MRDLTYAWRTLRKSPVFALTAVVTIALGIGATTAIFSVTNAVLLRPLPYKNPDRLVVGWSELRKRGVTDWPLSNANFFDLRSGTKAMFEDVAAVRTGRTIWMQDGRPEQVRVAAVTPNFFRLIGAKIAFGRDFSEADGQPPPAAGAPAAQRLPNITLLSYEFWQRRYGGDTSILGRTLPNGPEIVGVLAPGVELLFPPRLNIEHSPDVWFASRLPYDSVNFMREIESRLRSLPGVESVTASSPFPLADRFSPIRWGTGQALSDPSRFQAVDNQIVLPGYFEALRTPLIAGRTFTQDDNAPDRKVAVIDQFLAAKAFPNESAVGKQILIRIRTPQPEWVEVIGVVAHERNNRLADVGREQIYFTDGFLDHDVAARWALRTAGHPAKYAGAVRAELAKLDPQILIAETQTMDTLVERSQAGTRFSLLLIGAFAAVAVLLASVGLYGVLSTVVRQRTAEIGVRVALGATPASILKLVVGHGVRLSASGIVAGLVAAFLLTRVLTSMLVGVTPTDPATFVAMALLFAAIATIASWLPARRAAGLDPTAALRED